MAQMCLGLSDEFGPTIRPRFHERRVFVSFIVLVSSPFGKLTRLIPSGSGANHCPAPGAGIGPLPEAGDWLERKKRPTSIAEYSEQAAVRLVADLVFPHHDCEGKITFNRLPETVPIASSTASYPARTNGSLDS